MCDNMPAHPDVLLSPPQWSRAREQLSMKEVVRRSSTGGWGYPRWKELAQGPVLFLARGRGLCWPAAKWPTGASWCRAGGQELAPTPTGTGLRLQLVSQGTQLAGTPKTERLIFLWTIYNFTFFFFLLFLHFMSILNYCALSSCNYFLSLNTPT